MTPSSIRKSEAFTRIVVIVVIFLAVVLFIVPLMPQNHADHMARRVSCINNLKQIGVAYRIWANDHNDRFPAEESMTNGGWREVLTKANQGFLCWTNYAIMADEMGQSPKLAICLSDERKPADTFSNLVSNLNLSYFVGVSASASQPSSLLAGDRNLGRGTEARRDYGFSPASGQGNDVAIQTNSQADPVCWSLKMHSAGHSAGAGNILLGDGNAQQVTSASFRLNWQPTSGQTTNWPVGHTPSSPSIRVLFP